MRSRKFSPWCDSENKQNIPWATSLRAKYGTTAPVWTLQHYAIPSYEFRNSMAPLTQNVRDDPQSAPWNNENREFERGRQNMMGFSCMKQDCLRIHLFTSKAEKNIFLRDIHQIFTHITYKKASNLEKEIPYIRNTVDQFRFVVLPWWKWSALSSHIMNNSKQS